MGTKLQSYEMVNTLMGLGPVVGLAGAIVAVHGMRMPDVELYGFDVDEFFAVWGAATLVLGLVSALYGATHWKLITSRK